MGKALAMVFLRVVSGCASSGTGNGGIYIGLDKSCQNWLANNEGMGYYALVSWAHGYLQSQVEVMMEKEKLAGDPIKGITEKAVAGRLDDYCNANSGASMTTALRGWARELVGRIRQSGAR
jgi:hypothetical protein